MASQATETAVIETSAGDITLELDDKKAPKSVENFLAYAISGFYNSTIFHRVIKDFMVQGGGFTYDYEKKDTMKSIDNEADNGLRNEKYSIAMARTSDPHSATAQFFINTKNNAFLNHTNKSMRGWGYTVFGKVTKGFDVVDKINEVSTGSGGPFRSDAPKEKIVIRTIRLVAKPMPAKVKAENK
ncbi:MAG: peptidyl-prolyl cis-trans isomerase [Gammaproteobacteria bacterium]|nr:peptidyl-prolyl cis-trans isomerase [Gammaproteobacteria bacterium]